MIVLDTNVLSDRMGPRPSADVTRWLRGIYERDVFTTSIAQAEILYGLAILPQGKRRSGLEEAAQRMFTEDFLGRILSFDDRAAVHFVELASKRRREGRPIAVFDAMIAGIARANDAVLATRNVKDFDGTGVRLVDPWF